MDGEYESAQYLQPEVALTHEFISYPPGLTEHYDDEKWKKWEQATLSKLQQEGYIENQDGNVIVNVEKVKDFRFRDFKDGFVKSRDGIGTRDFIPFGKTTSEMFTRLFAERQVLVKGKEEEGFRQLIYIPEDEDAVFDISKILADRAVLGLWEIGTVKKWEDLRIPTRDDGFDSSVNMFEAAVPYTIYNKGNGRRQEGGLYVDSEPGNPDSVRQRFSASWLRNQGIRGPTDARLDEKPGETMEKYGSNWDEFNLLTLEDFPVKNSEKSTYLVANQGNVTIGNRIYNVGNEYEGAIVQRIAPGVYLATKENKEPLMFSSDFDPRTVSAMKTTDRGYTVRRIYVPKEALITPADEDVIRVVKYTYSNEGRARNREFVKVADSSVYIAEFRELYPDEIVEKIEEMNIEQQVAVMDAVSRGEWGESIIDYINTVNSDGMLLLADAILEGSITNRMLELSKLDPDQQREIFSLYTSVREQGLEFIYMLEDRLPKKDDTNIILMERLRQAWKYRLSDLASIAVEGHQNVLVDYYKTLNEAMRKAQSALKGDINWNLTKDYDSRARSTTGTYRFSDLSVMSITARPEQTDKGQQRLQITYTSPEGRKARVSIDTDEFGLSLDVASRNMPIHEAMKAAGKTYHTQEVFEPSVARDEEAFRNIIYSIPSILGW